MKSSVWGSGDLIFDHCKVVLTFPDIFAYQLMSLPIAYENEEWEYIEGKHIVRMDILHDESYWFCNIVYEETCKNE